MPHTIAQKSFPIDPDIFMISDPQLLFRKGFGMQSLSPLSHSPLNESSVSNSGRADGSESASHLLDGTKNVDEHHKNSFVDLEWQERSQKKSHGRYGENVRKWLRFSNFTFVPGSLVAGVISGHLASQAESTYTDTMKCGFGAPTGNGYPLITFPDIPAHTCVKNLPPFKYSVPNLAIRDNAFMIGLSAASIAAVAIPLIGIAAGVLETEIRQAAGKLPALNDIRAKLFQQVSSSAEGDTEKPEIESNWQDNEVIYSMPGGWDQVLPQYEPPPPAYRPKSFSRNELRASAVNPSRLPDISLNLPQVPDHDPINFPRIPDHDFAARTAVRNVDQAATRREATAMPS